MSSRNFSSSFTEFPAFMDTSSTEPRRRTWPQIHCRKTSAAQNAAMREIIRPWGSLSSTPPGCRAVSFSSWTKFSASELSSKSTNDLKASVLWAAQGTTPDYDPPLTEWVYLGADQPLVCGKPMERRVRNRRQQSSASWTTEPTITSNSIRSEPISFEKWVVKSVKITSSLLTDSLKMGSRAGLREPPNAAEVLVQHFGNDGLSSSQLPSAFDSDSEDEQD